MGNAESSVSKPTSRPTRQSDPHRGANISIQQEQPPPSLVSRPVVKMRTRTGSPLVWDTDIDLNSFKFLKSERICTYPEMGVPDGEDPPLNTSHHAIIASARSSTIMYDTGRRVIRQLVYHTPEDPRYLRHSLSPDGKILIRFNLKNRASNSCHIEAIHVENNTSFMQLLGSYSCNTHDAASCQWLDNSIVFIPDSKQGVITRWSLDKNNPMSSSIHPLPAIKQHRDLRIHLANGKRWQAIIGRTYGSPLSSSNGLIQLHDADKDEDRTFPGLACCLHDVDVYDHRKTLLFIGNASNGKISLKIQQLDKSAHGQPFQTIDVSVDMLTKEDSPWLLTVIEGLPIVVLVTIHNAIYFFELHSGAFLFSRPQLEDNWVIFRPSDDRSSLLLYEKEEQAVHRVSVNTEDLIGYIRQVLKNDTLASSVAIRTGLSGADDVMFHDMHADYSRDTLLE
ncbi:Clathrin heavy chain 2 [Tulasnella sp. 418]|nr:Clathrin heavy chain 2 [Tulasnella sp. 418]